MEENFSECKEDKFPIIGIVSRDEGELEANYPKMSRFTHKFREKIIVDLSQFKHKFMEKITMNL